MVEELLFLTIFYNVSWFNILSSFNPAKMRMWWSRQKTEANYVCYGLSVFSSIDRASPRQREDEGSFPGYFPLCWYLTIQPTAEFSEVYMV